MISLKTRENNILLKYIDGYKFFIKNLDTEKIGFLIFPYSIVYI